MPGGFGDQDFGRLEQLFSQHPSVKYLRLQWLDFGSILRVKVFPIKQILSMAKVGKLPSIVKAVLALSQNDRICPGFTPVGECKLYPVFESFLLGPRPGYATVQCEFQEQYGKEFAICPRSLLRKIVSRARRGGKEFLVGFEIEVVFIKPTVRDGDVTFTQTPTDQGHASFSSRALHDEQLLSLVEAILDQLEASSIPIQQFHPESAPGQYEFILAPLAPLAAVDTLIAAREIICATAARFSMRATLVPKPYPNAVGSGCHVHISMTPPEQHEAFLAGILQHLQAITAFTYGNATSFQRAVAGFWAGGTFVAWGTENRETPLRRIEGSHYELRCMDGFANMYLALSAILGAGFRGVQDREPLTLQDCQDDPATLSLEDRDRLGIKQTLPVSIADALSCLRKDTVMGEILGKPLVDHHLSFKEAELSMLEGMDDCQLRNWLIQRY